MYVDYLLKGLSIVGVFILGFLLNTSYAQDGRVGSMRIPEITLLHGSHTHVYALSPQGLSVFWAQGDSLRWIYDAKTLAVRGTQLSSDARFAYLYGSENRLTVIDPTLPQGLFATGIFPDNPLSVHRIGTRLWLLFPQGTLMQLSLQPTTRLETSLEAFEPLSSTGGLETGDRWVGLHSNQHELFAVSQKGVLATVVLKDGKGILRANMETGLSVRNLFLHETSLLLVTDNGDLFVQESTHKPFRLGNIEGEVTHAYAWAGGWIVRARGAGTEAKVWFFDLKQSVEASPKQDTNVAATKLLLRDDPNAGNHLIVNKNQLWISEHGRISSFQHPDQILASFRTQKSAPFRIQAIPNLSLPYPQPVLLSFHLLSFAAPENAQQADTSAQAKHVYWMAKRDGVPLPLKGNALKWLPETTDIGTHSIQVIAQSKQGAVDSTRFSLTLRPLNRPPYLMPLRPVRILPGETFRLQLIPIDPDASDRSLIAVQGRNFPEGLQLDPKTYELVWSPTPEQLGAYEIILLVTDEFGATASTTLSITVGTP